MSFPTRRRIYLMRHGEVEYFSERGQPFRPDEVPLTPYGRKQAEAAGEMLAGCALDRVLVSPLLRTMQTAELVLNGRPVPVEKHEELREIAPGKLRDLPQDADQIQQIFTNAFGVQLNPEDTFLGGESFGSMMGRVLPFIQRTLADSSWRNILMVAHGGVNRAILCDAIGVGLPGFGRFEQDPACVNILDVDEQGRMLVRLINFSPTNPPKEGHRLTTMEELFAKFLGIPVTPTSGAAS